MSSLKHVTLSLNLFHEYHSFASCSFTNALNLAQTAHRGWARGLTFSSFPICNTSRNGQKQNVVIIYFIDWVTLYFFAKSLTLTRYDNPPEKPLQPEVPETHWNTRRVCISVPQSFLFSTTDLHPICHLPHVQRYYVFLSIPFWLFSPMSWSSGPIESIQWTIYWQADICSLAHTNVALASWSRRRVLKAKLKWKNTQHSTHGGANSRDSASGLGWTTPTEAAVSGPIIRFRNHVNEDL